MPELIPPPHQSAPCRQLLANSSSPSKIIEHGARVRSPVSKPCARVAFFLPRGLMKISSAKLAPNSLGGQTFLLSARSSEQEYNLRTAGASILLRFSFFLTGLACRANEEKKKELQKRSAGWINMRPVLYLALLARRRTRKPS